MVRWWNGFGKWRECDVIELTQAWRLRSLLACPGLVLFKAGWWWWWIGFGLECCECNLSTLLLNWHRLWSLVRLRSLLSCPGLLFIIRQVGGGHFGGEVVKRIWLLECNPSKLLLNGRRGAGGSREHIRHCFPRYHVWRVPWWRSRVYNWWLPSQTASFWGRHAGGSWQEVSIPCDYTLDFC